MRDLFLSFAKKIGLLSGMVVLLCGCTENDEERIYNELMNKALAEKNAHPEAKIFDGEVEPEMPDRKVNDSTLFGVDANRNELRDDVEIWINRTFKDPNIRMAFKNKHKAFQRIMKAKVGNSEVSNRLILDEAYAVGCAMTFFSEYRDFDNHNTNLNKLSRNINDRAFYYNRIVSYITEPIGGPGYRDINEKRNIYCKFHVIMKD